MGKLLEGNANPDYGYNAANNTYTDLVKSGIIDPLKVGQHWPLCGVLRDSIHCVYCHSDAGNISRTVDVKKVRLCVSKHI